MTQNIGILKLRYLIQSVKLFIFNQLQEKGQTDQIITFIEKNPAYTSQLVAQNNWTIAMYAVRYGDHKLIRYLHSKDLLYEHPQSSYSIIHACCFNNDVDTLKLLIDELGKDPNCQCQFPTDNSPLKYAYKNESYKTIEFLCSRGAYYTFDNFCNNMIRELVPIDSSRQLTTQQLIAPTSQNNLLQTQQSEYRYKTVKDKTEIQPHQILFVKPARQQSDQRDRNIQEYIRYSRYRNILFVKQTIDQYQKSQKIALNTKLKFLNSIFAQDYQFKQFLTYI